MSRIAATKEAESNDLELHVSLCTERYEELTDKLESMDQKLTEAAAAMIDLKLRLESNKDSTYLKWAIAIISALVAALLHFLTK